MIWKYFLPFCGLSFHSLDISIPCFVLFCFVKCKYFIALCRHSKLFFRNLRLVTTLLSKSIEVIFSTAFAYFASISLSHLGNSLNLSNFFITIIFVDSLLICMVKSLLLCFLSMTTLLLYPFVCGFLRCCGRFIPVPQYRFTPSSCLF